MNIKDIKIAICFSGQIRTGVLTFNNIKNFIGDLIDQCDVFIHTWDVRSQTSSDLSIATALFKEPDSLFEEFSKLWNPKKMIVEDFIQWRKMGICIEPLFYSLYECDKLRKKYQKENNFRYDFIIKIRPDFIYNIEHKLKDELEIILNSDYENSIYTMDFGNVISLNKFEDVFWIAYTDVFDIAVNFYYQRLEGNTCDWQTEMAEYLTKNNIQYKRLYLGNNGIPYRWSNLYEDGRTVEDYENNWEKYFFNLPY
jgi:hypothetical protein